MVKLTDQDLLRRQQEAATTSQEDLNARAQAETVQNRIEQEIHNTPKPTIIEQVKASLLTGNVVAATANRQLQNFENHMQAEDDPNFDVISELESKNALHLFDSDLAKAKTKSQLDDMVEFKLQTSKLQGKLSGIQGGLVDFTVNAVTDPLNLAIYALPGAAAFAGGYKSAKVLKGAVLGAGIATGSALIQNEILNRNIIGRRDQVDASHVALVSGILGSTFGAIGGALAPGEQALTRAVMATKLAGKEVRHQYNPKTGEFKLDPNVEKAIALSVDPNNVDTATKASLNVAIPYLTKSISGEILNSPFQNMVKFGTSMFDNSFDTIGVKAGLTKNTAADLKMKNKVEFADSINRKVTDLYVQYAKRTKKLGEKPISLSQFDDEIHYAQSKGGESYIPEVAASAQIWAKHLDEAILDAKKVGIDIGDVREKGFGGWAGRAWNVDAIVAEKNAGKNDWIDLEAASILAHNRQIRAQEALKVKGEGPPTDSLNKGTPELTLAEATKMAKLKRDHIIGFGRNSVSNSNLLGMTLNNDGRLTSNPKWSKERSTLMGDEAAGKYLLKNATAINSATYKSISAQTIFKQTLIDNGFETLEDVRDAITKEADDMISKGDTSRDWTRESLDAISKVDEYAEIALGIYTKADRPAYRYLKAYNTMIRLPGALISSIGDPFMNILSYGLKDTISGYANLIYRTVTDLKGLKVDFRTAKDVGITFDLFTNKVLKTIDEQDVPFHQLQNKGDRFVGHAMDYFGITSGLTPWTNTHRFVSGTLSQKQLLDIMDQVKSKGWNSLRVKDQKRLLRLDITEKDAISILAEKETWSKGLGNFITNHQNWDPKIAEKFKTAVLKETNETILMADKGDYSRAAIGSGVSKLIYQFSSYAFAAQNKVFSRGFNRGDMNFAIGVPLLIGANILGYKLKSYAAGKDTSKDSVSKLTLEGITRAGILTKGLDLLSAVNPIASSSRYADKDFLEISLGPSSGTSKDIFQVGSRAIQVGMGLEDLSGNKVKFTEGDVNKFQGLIPLGTHPLYRDTLNKYLVKQITGKPRKKRK